MATSLYTQLSEALWRRRVEENHLLVVRRYGKKIWFGGPGFVLVNPLIEDVVGELYVGFRKAELTVDVQSADGVTLIYGLLVYFVFDPRQALPAYQRSLTVQVLHTSDAFEQMLRAFLGAALRQAAAERSALELVGGAQIAGLARRLQEETAGKLAELGVQLKNAISIHLAQTPPWLQEAVADIRYLEALRTAYTLADDRLESYLFNLKLVRALANSRGVVNLFLSSNGAELLPQLGQQLAAGAGPGHRTNTANRPPHRRAPFQDSMFDQES